MKTFIKLTFMLLCVATLAACTSASKKQDKQNNAPYERKIYLTEEDYMEDLEKNAHSERRQAKPNTESQYIFEVLPETAKNVYFFDERVRPMVPDQPSDRDYKNTKRLHEKPKRYSPQQYYGGQAPAPAAGQAQGSSYADENNGGYEMDY